MEIEKNKLYVGNLNYTVTSEMLESLFNSFGIVKSVKLIEGKGFAFVEMETPEEAGKALEALNDREYEGRPMKVDLAKPYVGKNRR